MLTRLEHRFRESLLQSQLISLHGREHTDGIFTRHAPGPSTRFLWIHGTRAVSKDLVDIVHSARRGSFEGRQPYAG
jgi:hypothetical protein